MPPKRKAEPEPPLRQCGCIRTDGLDLKELFYGPPPMGLTGCTACSNGTSISKKFNVMPSDGLNSRSSDLLERRLYREIELSGLQKKLSFFSARNKRPYQYIRSLYVAKDFYDTYRRTSARLLIRLIDGFEKNRQQSLRADFLVAIWGPLMMAFATEDPRLKTLKTKLESFLAGDDGPLKAMDFHGGMLEPIEFQEELLDFLENGDAKRLREVVLLRDRRWLEEAGAHGVQNPLENHARPANLLVEFEKFLVRK